VFEKERKKERKKERRVRPNRFEINEITRRKGEKKERKRMIRGAPP